MGLCPSCNWRRDLSVPTCARCEYLAAKPQRMGFVPVAVKPFSKIEKLYLAVLVLLDDGLASHAPGGEAETAMLMGVAGRLLQRRLQPPTPVAGGPRYALEIAPTTVEQLPTIGGDGRQPEKLPLGTPVSLLREYVARGATRWRSHDCPL